MEATTEAARPPVHYWIVTAVAVLWNGFGAYDYVMTLTQGETYLRGMGMTEAQIAYYDAMPGWVTGVWAVGVWGAVAGAILLVLRSRFATHAFAISLAGLLVSLVYTHLLSDGTEVMGSQAMMMSAVVTAACVFFVWYARAMAKRGVLR